MKERSRKYVKAMMRAIDIARQGGLYDGGRTASRANGLRVIRRFEEVNGCTFNPFDKAHRDKVACNGMHEGFFRRARLLFARQAKR